MLCLSAYRLRSNCLHDRLTKPIVILLAGEGIRISIYIDDGWILALLRELAAQYLARTLQVLESAGFVVSKEKSDTPADISQIKRRLGFLVDSTTMIISASTEKLAAISDLVHQTLQSPSYPARSVAKLTGKLIALRPALGPVVFVLCRLAQSELAAFTDNHPWSAKMLLSHEASSALLLLADSLLSFNGYPIRNESTAKPLSSFLGESAEVQGRSVYGINSVSAIYASDASTAASCTYDVRSSTRIFHQAPFSVQESALSSGHRELLAVHSALSSIPEAFRSKTSASVFWLTDSENMVTFLTRGPQNGQFKRPFYLYFGCPITSSWTLFQSISNVMTIGSKSLILAQDTTIQTIGLVMLHHLKT